MSFRDLVLDFERRRLMSGDQEFAIKRVRPRSTVYGKRFSIMFHDGAAHLATLNLPPTSWRTLMLCFAHLDFREWRLMPIADLVSQLAVTQGAVSKALSQLVAKKVLETKAHARIRSAKVYRLSPSIGWLGTAGAYHATMRERTVDGDTLDQHDQNLLDLYAQVEAQAAESRKHGQVRNLGLEAEALNQMRAHKQQELALFNMDEEAIDLWISRVESRTKKGVRR